MNEIIVSVTNAYKTFLIDLELPCDVAAGELTLDIIEALNGYDPRLCMRGDSAVLFCNRTGKRLKKDQTLKDAGVWNGDFITVLEA